MERQAARNRNWKQKEKDMTAFTENAVKANDLTVHYYQAGDPRHPAILFLHGVMDNGLCWTPVARDLAAEYHVIMTDARGHGKTGGSLADFSIATLAGDAAAVIQALDLEKPFVWGHSMGAITATLLAANHPDLLRAAILEDPPFLAEKQEEVFGGAASEQAAQMFQELLALRTLTPAERLVKARAFNPLWAEAELEPWAESKAQFNMEVLQSVGSMGKTPWKEPLARITCPLLLLTGDPANHAIVTPEVAAEAQQLWQKGEVAHLSGAGHNVHRDRYPEAMAAARAFLSRH